MSKVSKYILAQIAALEESERAAREAGIDLSKIPDTTEAKAPADPSAPAPKPGLSDFVEFGDDFDEPYEEDEGDDSEDYRPDKKAIKRKRASKSAQKSYPGQMGMMDAAGHALGTRSSGRKRGRPTKQEVADRDGLSKDDGDHANEDKINAAAAAAAAAATAAAHGNGAAGANFSLPMLPVAMQVPMQMQVPLPVGSTLNEQNGLMLRFGMGVPAQGAEQQLGDFDPNAAAKAGEDGAAVPNPLLHSPPSMSIPAPLPVSSHSLPGLPPSLASSLAMNMMPLGSLSASMALHPLSSQLLQSQSLGHPLSLGDLHSNHLGASLPLDSSLQSALNSYQSSLLQSQLQSLLPLGTMGSEALNYSSLQSLDSPPHSMMPMTGAVQLQEADKSIQQPNNQAS